MITWIFWRFSISLENSLKTLGTTDRGVNAHHYWYVYHKGCWMNLIKLFVIVWFILSSVRTEWTSLQNYEYNLDEQRMFKDRVKYFRPLLAVCMKLWRNFNVYADFPGETFKSFGAVIYWGCKVHSKSWCYYSMITKFETDTTLAMRWRLCNNSCYVLVLWSFLNGNSALMDVRYFHVNMPCNGYLFYALYCRPISIFAATWQLSLLCCIVCTYSNHINSLFVACT